MVRHIGWQRHLRIKFQFHAYYHFLLIGRSIISPPSTVLSLLRPCTSLLISFLPFALALFSLAHFKSSRPPTLTHLILRACEHRTNVSCHVWMSPSCLLVHCPRFALCFFCVFFVSFRFLIFFILFPRRIRTIRELNKYNLQILTTNECWDDHHRALTHQLATTRQQSHHTLRHRTCRSQLAIARRFAEYIWTFWERGYMWVLKWYKCLFRYLSTLTYCSPSRSRCHFDHLHACQVSALSSLCSFLKGKIV